MNYILFDGPNRNNLLPFTFTRPVADIRVGIKTIREKWEMALDCEVSVKTEDYLTEKFAIKVSNNNILINASYCPTAELVEQILKLKDNQVLTDTGEIVAYYSNNPGVEPGFIHSEKLEITSNILAIKHTWDIFSKNGEALQLDFEAITQGRKSQPIPENINTINPENIFIEEGATLNFVTLNASTGPIYIGKDSQIMEGSIIRGPFALCKGAIVKMAAKIYGPTTIGPGCKVGGEVNNSVMFANSNKGHDGFLGNSVLGEWCNLGADTNTSNLKNNYAEVRLWNYNTKGFTKTGLQFCGLMMGDHSKCGINTMFNTGTVVGVNANIYGGNFPRNFIPSFSWGGHSGFTVYKTEKAFEVAKVVMARRKINFTDEDRRILSHVFELTSEYR